MFWILQLLVLQFFLIHGNASETVEQAASLARQLVDSDDSVGTLATVFASDHPSFAGRPFALMEYYASCYTNGSLALIFMPISQNNRNILSSPTHAATVTVRAHPAKASSARVALIGNVTIQYGGVDEPELEKCFVKRHPDAAWWLPNKKPAHTAYWARFDPYSIYYVGGFGDEHFIGFIPVPLYQASLQKDPLAGRLRIQDHYDVSGFART